MSTLGHLTRRTKGEECSTCAGYGWLREENAGMRHCPGCDGRGRFPTPETAAARLVETAAPLLSALGVALDEADSLIPEGVPEKAMTSISLHHLAGLLSALHLDES